MPYHLSSHGVPLPALAEHGWMGVDLFLVLSGYLAGRALRILPACFAVLFLYVALPGWRETDALQPLWKYATFTVNLWPDWAAGSAFSHAWSPCVEVHFYLLLSFAVCLFPLLAAGCACLLAGALSPAPGWMPAAAGHPVRRGAGVQSVPDPQGSVRPARRLAAGVRRTHAAGRAARVRAGRRRRAVACRGGTAGPRLRERAAASEFEWRQLP